MLYAQFTHIDVTSLQCTLQLAVTELTAAATTCDKSIDFRN